MNKKERKSKINREEIEDDVDDIFDIC